MEKIWNLNIIKGSILLLLVLFSSFFFQPQLLKTLPADVKFLTSDHLNNVYFINNQNNIIKIGPDFSTLTFNENRYGAPAYIDASNPLKILAYYPIFNTIVILNNRMAPQSIINLSNLNLIDIPVIAASLDNRIWIFDQYDFKLKKLDDAGQVVVQSENLSFIKSRLNPNFILHKNNRIYLNDPSEGILVFDDFGTYFKTIFIQNLSQFQIIDDQLVYLKDNKLNIFNLKTFEEHTAPLPDISEMQSVSIQKSRLFISTKDELLIYSH